MKTGKSSSSGWLPDIDPSIALAQTMRAEVQLRGLVHQKDEINALSSAGYSILAGVQSIENVMRNLVRTLAFSILLTSSLELMPDESILEFRIGFVRVHVPRA